MKQNFIIYYLLQVLAQLDLQQGHAITYHKENENYFIPQLNSLILESDKNHLSDIRSIDFKFIESAFTIKSFSDGKLINQIFLDSFSFQRITTYCVCQLLQNEFFNFITCIDGIFIIKSNKTIQYHKNAKQYKINLYLKTEELCSELFMDSENQVIVLCFSQELLKIYKINLSQQNSIVWQETNDQDLNNCMKKVLYIEQISLLAFYNCQNWKIINITQNEYSTILNKELGKKMFPLIFAEIQYMTEIFTCYSQNRLYLVESQNQYIFLFQNNELVFIDKYERMLKIKQIVLNEYCSMQYIVLENQVQKTESVQLEFNLQNKEIIINSDINVYVINQFLLLQKGQDLQLILCNFLNQTYKIFPSKLHFIKQSLKTDNLQFQTPNFFFLIDSFLNEAVFYKYNDLPRFIQLNRNYLFEIFNFNIFTNNSEQAFIIHKIIDKQREQIKQFDIIIQNNCQSYNSVQFQKKQYGLPSEYKLQFFNNEILIDIQAEQDFYHSLPVKVNNSITQILWINISKFGQVSQMIYFDEEQLQIMDFQNNKQFNYGSFKGQYVYSSQYCIAMLDFKMKSLQRIFAYNNKNFIQDFNFSQEIKQATQCLDLLILQFIDETYCIFDVQALKIIQLENQFKDFGTPHCYFARSTSKLIQFENVLVYKLNKIYNFAQIENIELVSVIAQAQSFKITALHKDLDKIIVYHVDLQQIVQLNEFELRSSTLVKPFVYKYNLNYISIAAMTNQNKSILTISTDNTISIIDIKYCDSFNFIQQTETLIYFDQNQTMKILSLEYYNLIIKNSPFQINYYSKQSVNFQITPLQLNSILDQQKTLNIITLNYCNQIIKKQSTVFLENNSIINIADFFSGQIQQITTNNEKQLKVFGPFLNKKAINICDNNQFFNQFCFIKYEFADKPILNYFSCKCIPQIQYCKFNFYETDVQLLKQHIYQLQMVAIIKYNYYYFLHIFEIDFHTHTLSEVSYQQIMELNKEDEILKIENKNMIILITVQQINQIQQFILYYFQQNYSTYIVKDKIFDICNIQNNADYYLFLQTTPDKTHQQQLTCQFVSFINNQRQVIFSFILGSEFEALLLQNHFYFQNLHSCKIQFTSCDFIQQQIQLNLMFISDISNTEFCFSSVIKIVYNTQNEEKQYQFLKILRNPTNNTQNLHYIDSSYLIFRSDKNFYLYNLTSYQAFYDYVYRIENANFSLFRINTTHYILDNNLKQQLVEIGFVINTSQNIEHTTQNSTLIAINELSKAEIQVIFIIRQHQYDKYLVFAFSLFIFLIILIFLIRRLIIKSQQNQNSLGVQQKNKKDIEDFNKQNENTNLSSLNMLA